MAGARLRVDFRTLPEELRAGLKAIIADRPEHFCVAGEPTGCACRDDQCTPIDLTFARDEALQDRLSLAVDVEQDGREVRVAYGQKAAAFRALGRLLGQLVSGNGDGVAISPFRERSRFDTLGIMVDASRNGVLRVDVAKRLLRHVALMGINACMLYTEDTYEVPGRPFFGYLRGRYTRDELEELDDYAFDLGIEMIPCIQTLAHLEQVLQWPAFQEVRDTASVLLAEDEKTYELVEEMILAASSPFRTKRIHVGMDEAWGIATGRYKEFHGERRPFDVLNAHLGRVREICRRHGLRPMIWSDMYFRLGSKTHDYYDRDTVIPEDVKRAIPKDVDLVYWDYYHLDPGFYAEWIDRHRELGSDPVMAGGVWTWDRLWASLPFSFTTTDACMRACKQKGLREAFVTMWGDDGMECDVLSALPGIQFFAEHGYTAGEAVDQHLLRLNFRGACGADADFDDWVKASEVDAPPGVDDPGKSHANPGKWLLWQDPLLAVMDPLVEGLPLREHYERLARALFAAAEKASRSKRQGGARDDGRQEDGRATRAETDRGFNWGRRLLLPAYLAHALALKSELRRRLAEAYAKDDRATLRQMAATDIPALQAAVDDLWKVHRDTWMATYKPFGWEVIERRYGGLQARLATLADRIAGYLNDELDAIPELEVKLERPMESPPGTLPEVHYARVATPSTIK
ncbi:beta-N-acetylhexosaminidase [Carboxydochorda subterranea]|uniref:Beta-N-acetylhexosaminidase n=1 Tax=Carboxydichorda subterranea TaxID=3109565 RepID=A0ABZ1BXL5_9FIRM|nr:beta-N-acetylhexosaminidase [Limnochorda sp. L945t]WRP17522.1 beta-N-acetylhexosaminidase [Limnochorda sp. L945t]